MLTKKQKITIAILMGVAFLALILALVFLTTKPDDSKSDVVIDIQEYEEAIHKVAESGQFPTDIDILSEMINSNLANNTVVKNENGLNAITNDNHNIVITPFTNNIVSILMDGKDKTLYSQDDVELLIVITVQDGVATVMRKESSVTCTHKYDNNVVSEATCVTQGITTMRCTLCNAYRTLITMAYGHDFDDNGCSSTSLCSNCNEPATNKEHYFVIMNPTDEYLLSEGSCNKAAKYFYQCLYCKEKSPDKTYSYINDSNHKVLKDEKIFIDSFTFIHRLYCEECKLELLSAVISNRQGVSTGDVYQPTFYSLDKIVYSLDDVNFTEELPQISTSGKHNVYYVITRGDYSLHGNAVVDLQDMPQIKVDQFNNTSMSNPYYVETPEFVLTGTVTDADGIQIFRINGQHIQVNTDGKWEYHGNLGKDNNMILTFFAEDNEGVVQTINHFIAMEQLEKPIIVEIIHTNENVVELTGQVKNLENLKEMYMNDTLIKVDQNGYWKAYAPVTKNSVSRVTITTVSKDGQSTQVWYEVCHCNVEPSINATKVNGNTIQGSIMDGSGLDCSTIESIKVYNVSHLNGISFTNCTIMNDVIQNGYTLYEYDNENSIDTIDFVLDLSQYAGQTDFEIEINTTHGQQMIYKFSLEWKDSKVETIHLEIINTVTNTYRKMDIPMALADMIL